MPDVEDWNKNLIEEFRSSGGELSGPLAGAPVLLLTTTGAKTGRQHTTPVMYLADGDRLAVFATKAGAPTNPDWYHNLLANPRATVEVGTETFEVDAEVATPEERNRLYAIQAERYPGFAEYEAMTSRVIPVVLLRRVPVPRRATPRGSSSSRRIPTTSTSAPQARWRPGRKRASTSPTAS